MAATRQKKIVQITITVTDQRNSKAPICNLVVTRRHRKAAIFFYPNTVNSYKIRSMWHLAWAHKMIGMKLIKTRWYGQRLTL